MALADLDLTTITDDELATLTKAVQAEQQRRTILTTTTTRLATLLADYISAGGSANTLTITQTTSEEAAS